MINLLMLLVVSVVLSFAAMYITKYTKIPFLLVFIFIGFILQFLGFNNYESVVSSMNTYTQAVSITIIYVMAGYALELKKQERLTILYGTIPVTVMWVLGTIVGIIIASFFMEINLITMLIISSVAGIVVASTPVLFLNLFNSLPAERKNTKNSALILSGAVFDQIPSFLMIVVPLIVAIGVGKSTGGSSSIFVSIISVLILLIVVIIVGFIITKVIFKLFLGKINDFLVLGLIVLAMVLMVNLIPIFAGQYLTAGIGAGLALNAIKDYDLTTLKGKFAKLSGLFAFPIMFLYLGITTPFLGILSIQMILLAVVFYLFFVVLKSLIGRQILIKENCTKAEKSLGISFILLSGSTYINMAISFQSVFEGLGFLNLATNLISIGIIIYIFSIIISTIIVRNKDIINKIFKI